MMRLSAIDSSDTVISTMLRRGSFMTAGYPRRRPRATLQRADALQGRAGPPLDGSLVCLRVRLVDHGGLGHDFLRNRLLAQRTDRDLGAEAAFDETVIIAARQHLAGLDEVDRFLAGIDADDRRERLFRLLERLDRAEGHGVVGGQNAVDLRGWIQFQHALEQLGGGRARVQAVLREDD